MNDAPSSLPAPDAPCTRVVFVDIHGSTRELLTQTFERKSGYALVGHGRTGSDALRLGRELQPDLMILELILPEMCATTVMTELRSQGLPTRFIIYTGSDNEEAMIDALRAAPEGFAGKAESFVAFYSVLQQVVRGGCAVSPSYAALQKRALTGKPGITLTERERAVLKLIAEGKTTKEIAALLHASERAIQHNRTSIMAKLGAHDLARLTLWAVQLGLVPPRVP